jgi:hypothetical protein
MTRRRWRSLVACTLAVLSGPALAQGTTAVLTGKVLDASAKTPVEGVVITLRSPALQGGRDAYTEPDGSYRVSQLPVGVYTVRFEHPSFRPYEHQGVVLRLDTTVKLQVELLPSQVELKETIVVDGRPPLVDVASAQTGASLDRDFLTRIAVAQPLGKGAAQRSFTSLAEVAPGAVNDAYGVSITGTTSPENGYVLDGLSVNDPGFGLAGTELTMDFIQEVNVITGGYLPEYGRATGGVVNAVTKSGSNEFHGSVFGNLTPGALVSEAREIRQEAGTVSGRASLWNVGDFGAEVGGPILKDKLWFFAGLAPSFTRYQIQRNLNAILYDQDGNAQRDAEGFTLTERIAGTERRYFADQRNLQYIGKLTYNLAPDHTVSLSVAGAPSSSGGPGRFAISGRTGAPETQRVYGHYDAVASQIINNSLDASLKWSSAFLDHRLLVDATLGWHRQDQAIRGSDGSRAGSGTGLSRIAQVNWARAVDPTTGDPSYHSITEFEQLPDPSVCDPVTPGGPTRCPVLNYATGGPGFLNELAMDRYQAKVVGTYLLKALGEHVIKAGVDLEAVTMDQTKALSGRVAYLEADDGTYFQDFRQYGYLTGPDTAVILDVASARSSSTLIGGFVQDSWSVGGIATLNAGVRYDLQTLVGGGKTAMVLPNQWSPRIGLIVDPTTTGKSKLFANFARYYESVPLDMVDRQFPGERQVTSYRDAAMCNPLSVEQQQGSCQDPAARLPFRPALDASQLWATTGGVPTIVDPAIQPQSNDELVVGGEYEIFPNARAGATYTRRTMGRVIEDMSRDDGATYFIGNPGYGMAADFPKATRDYDAVTVYLDKRFADGWLANVSYTWSSLRGNYEGLFRADTLQLDPNINSDFDLVSLLPNRTGPLAGDRTHQVKVFASKDFLVGSSVLFNLGLSYRGTSGRPISYLGAHELYGAGEAYLLPRGSAGRLPWTHRVDTHLGVSYRMSQDNLVTLTADVFNLFNFQALTAVDENYTFAEVVPVEGGTEADLVGLVDIHGDPVVVNPNFRRPTGYQAPRSIRFGAKVTF